MPVNGIDVKFDTAVNWHCRKRFRYQKLICVSKIRKGVLAISRLGLAKFRSPSETFNRPVVLFQKKNGWLAGFKEKSADRKPKAVSFFLDWHQLGYHGSHFHRVLMLRREIHAPFPTTGYSPRKEKGNKIKKEMNSLTFVKTKSRHHGIISWTTAILSYGYAIKCWPDS